MKKIINGKAPKYLKDLFRPKEVNSQVDLRNSQNKLAVLLLKQIVISTIIILWNTLGSSERMSASFFKKT